MSSRRREGVCHLAAGEAPHGEDLWAPGDSERHLNTKHAVPGRSWSALRAQRSRRNYGVCSGEGERVSREMPLAI